MQKCNHHSKTFSPKWAWGWSVRWQSVQISGGRLQWQVFYGGICMCYASFTSGRPEQSRYGLQIIASCGHFLAGVAGIRYRTLFQKREFQATAPREPSRHLMGARLRIRCLKPGGRRAYPSGPVSPSCITITLISLRSRAWWSPTWKMINNTFFFPLLNTLDVQ